MCHYVTPWWVVELQYYLWLDEKVVRERGISPHNGKATWNPARNNRECIIKAASVMRVSLSWLLLAGTRHSGRPGGCPASLHQHTPRDRSGPAESASGGILPAGESLKLHLGPLCSRPWVKPTAF